MNIYGYIILAALLLDFCLNRLSDLLTLRHMGSELPPELADVYDAERYAKSQAYTRTKMRFGLITASFDLALLLAFWKFGGFAILDKAMVATGWSALWQGLAYIGVIMAAKGVLDLPFSIYSTFVIEERFGFNQTTVRTFVMDLVKGTLLGIAIGGPILAGVLAFFIHAGALAWLWAWLAVTVITLLLQVVAPIWIMPLFNKFTPIEEGELKEKITAYAQKVGFKMAGIFVMDGSKRSAKANAFFTGLGRHRRIALFDTLIEKQTSDELLAVLAHEVGHNKKRHILWSTLISVVHSGVLFYLLSRVLTLPALFENFGTTQSVHAGLIFFGLLYTPVEMLLSLAMSAFSRRNEYQADRFAVETTGLGQAMISALKKLSASNLSNLTPHPFEVVLHHSHPPVLQRIRAIAALNREDAD